MTGTKNGSVRAWKGHVAAAMLVAFLLALSSSVLMPGIGADQDSVDLTATYDDGTVSISGTAPSWVTTITFEIYDESDAKVASGYSVVSGGAFSASIRCTLGDAGTVKAVARGVGYTPATSLWAIETSPKVVDVASVVLNADRLSLRVTDTYALVATVFPSNATDQTVAWSCSGTAISLDSGGNIKAVSIGTATVTATAGGCSASCVVDVLPDATFTYLLRMDYAADEADYGVSGLDAESLREGITLTSQGHDAGVALEKVLNENGIPCSFWSGDADSESMKYWVDQIFGLGDKHYDNGAWRYWIQYHDGEYNDLTLGYYTDGGQFSLIFGMTDVDGSVIEPVDIPSADRLTYNGLIQEGIARNDAYTVSGASAKNVGSYSATLVLSDGHAWRDSTFDSKTVPWSISPANLTAAYVGETISVGNPPSLQVSVTGFVNGETASTASGYVAPTVASPSSSAGTYVLTPSGGSAVNYSFTYVPGILKIGDVDQQVSVPYAATGLVYSGSYQTGVPSGTGYAVSGNTAKNAGTYTATLSLSDGCVWSDGTYGDKTVSWTIARAPLVARYIGETISEGGTPALQVAVTGFVNGETASTAASYVAPAVSTSATSAGTYTLVPSGGSAKNYSFSYVSGKLIIVAEDRPIPVPSAATGLVYSGSYQTGVPSGTGYAVSGNTAKNAGTYSATVSLKDGYTWSDGTYGDKTVSWTIARAPLVARYVGETISEGGSPALQVAVTGFVNGETASTATGYVAPTVSTGATSAGTYTLTPSGGSAKNYSFSYVSGKLIIVAEDRPIPVPSAATGLVYSGSYQTGVPSGTGYAVSGNTAKNAGTYTAILSLSDGCVWSDGTCGDKTMQWTISRAVLTARYAGETISEGDVPALKVTVTGFVNGETASTATGYVAPTVSTGATSAGTYTLTPSGGSAKNYSFSYVPGKLTIESGEQAVEVPSAVSGLVYDGSYQIGVPAGQSYSITGNVMRNAGTYVAVVSLDDGCVWSDGTYDDKTISWTISRVVLTAAYVSETIREGGSPAFEVSITGFVNGETASTATGYVAPTVSTGATSAGTYTLTPSGGSARNYAFTYQPGVLTIASGTSVGDVFTLSGLVYTVTSVDPRQVSLTGYEECPSRLYVPASVYLDDKRFEIVSIGERAFYGCTDLEHLDAGGAAILARAFTNCTSLESVSAGSSIGSYAFYGCSSLESAILSEGVGTIGVKAFAHCTSIESLSVPSSVSSVGSNAFYGLKFYDGDSAIDATAESLSGSDFMGSGKSLWKVNAFVGDSFVVDGLQYSITSSDPWEASLVGYESVPAALVVPETVAYGGVRISVVSIGGSAFKGCTAITSADLGSVSAIGVKAFANCTKLAAVDVGDSLQTLSAYAFYRCVKMTDINIEDSAKTLKVIGSYAFYYCKSLGSVAVPSYVKTIGTGSFPADMTDGDGSVLETTAESLAGYVYDRIGGVFVRQTGADIGKEYSLDGLKYRVVALLPAELEVCGYYGSVSDVSVPDAIEFEGIEFEVVAIGDSAFKGCTKLKTISMGSIERIGSLAFYGCNKLGSVEMDSVSTIGVKAFARCSGLSDIGFGDSLKTVSAYAFYGCGSLPSLELPDSATVVGSYAFYGCSGLVHAYLGESLKTIGSKTFAQCTSLSSVDILGPSVAIGADSFDSCPLEHIMMPEKVRKLGSGAFSGAVFMSIGGSEIGQTAKNLSGKVFEGSDGVLREL